MLFDVKSLHKKVIIAYMPIFLTCVIVVSSLYILCEKILDYQVSNTIDVQIDNTISVIENELLKVNYIQADFFQNIDVQRLTYFHEVLSEDERLRAINGIITKVEDTSLFTSFLNNICVIINNGSDTQIYDSRGMLQHEGDDYIEVYNCIKERKVIIKNNNIYLRLDSDDLLSEGKSISVIAQISERQLEALLKIIVDYDGSIVCLTTDDNEYLLVQGDKSAIDAAQIKRFIDEGKRRVRISNETYLFNSVYSIQTGIYINKFVRVEESHSALATVRVILIAFMVMSVAMICFLSRISKKTIKTPLKKMLDSLSYVEKGDFEHKIYHDSKDEFSHIFESYNDILDNLKETIKKMNEYASLKKEAELKQLQAQIEPHFLFNSFYIQRRMLRLGDYEALEKFINHLGKYFEYIHNDSEEMIPLLREYEHVNNYIEIQKMRFGDRIHIDISEPDSGIGEVLVPRLIIQPLVENSFEYALEDMEKDAKLKVRFEYYNEDLYIIVEDNGRNITENKVNEINHKIQNEKNIPSALKNINRRLKHKFGEESGVILQYIEGGGVRVIEKIRIGKINRYV